MAERNDAAWDRKLNIRTGASAFEPDDQNHSRYEPTPYAVLERLAQQGGFRRESVLVDYGCGKGRVALFLNRALGMKTIGVEYDPGLHAAAMENLRSCGGKRWQECGAGFELISAEQYLPDGADCFYFFNPFSEKILRSVLGRILQSYYRRPRNMRLYFYYALDDTIACLMDRAELSFAGEIDCRDLFHNPDPREKILIYSIDASE